MNDLVSSAPAVTQAIRVLQTLAGHATPQPAAAVARTLDMPRSSIYRILQALEAEGFARHFPETRRWGLGPGAYELGSAYTRQAPLQRLARSIMTQLAEVTQECSHLATLHGRDVLYLIEERPLGRQPLVTDVGVRLPAVATATGKSMLAALPAAQIRALFPTSNEIVRRNGLGTSNLSELRAELGSVRAQGYASESGTVTTGFDSVAFAVLDSNGLPAAGIGVTWSTIRKGAPDEAAQARIVEACRSAARQLEERLDAGRSARAKRSSE